MHLPPNPLLQLLQLMEGLARQASQHLMAAMAVAITPVISNPTLNLMAVLQKHGAYEPALHYLLELIAVPLAPPVAACLKALDGLLGILLLMPLSVIGALLVHNPVFGFAAWLLPSSLALALHALLEWFLLATDAAKWRIAAYTCGACFRWRYQIRQFLGSRTLVRKEWEEEHVDEGQAEGWLSMFPTLLHYFLVGAMGILCLLVCLGLAIDGVPAAAGLVKAVLGCVVAGFVQAPVGAARALLYPRSTFHRRIGTLTRSIISTSAAALHPHFASTATTAPSPANTATTLGKRLLSLLTPPWSPAPRRSKHYVACSFAVEFIDPLAVVLANMGLPILVPYLDGLMTLELTALSDVLLPHAAPQQHGGYWLVQLLMPLVPMLEALFLPSPLFRPPSMREVFLLGEKKHRWRGGGGGGFAADWPSAAWDVPCTYALMAWAGWIVQWGLCRPLAVAAAAAVTGGDAGPPHTKGTRRWLTQGALRAGLWEVHCAAALGTAAVYSTIGGVGLVAGLLDWGKDKGVWFGKEHVWQMCEVVGRRRPV